MHTVASTARAVTTMWLPGQFSLGSTGDGRFKVCNRSLNICKEYVNPGQLVELTVDSESIFGFAPPHEANAPGLNN